MVTTNMSFNRSVLFLDKLQLHIYTIGYRNSGECILFFLENDFGICYSGLIDCYQVNGINVAIELLQQYGVNGLDFLCWTHPHVDHTLGLEVILHEFVTEKTKFVYPLNIKSINRSQIPQDAIPVVGGIIDIIESAAVKKAKVRPVSGTSRIESISFGNGRADAGSNFLFQIYSLSPDPNTVEKRDSLNKVVNINDYSVALSLSLGNKVFVFCSDIQDQTIRKIEYYPSKIDYLKIPHHGSEHSLKIIDWIMEEKVGIACTTEYKKSKLPRAESIEKYLMYSENLYSTHNGVEEFGYLYTVYNVKTDTFFNYTEGRMEKVFSS